MASAGFDCQLLIWDLEEETVALEMESLPQPVRLNNTYLQYTRLFILCMETINPYFTYCHVFTSVSIN